jgi:hypothetical protein
LDVFGDESPPPSRTIRIGGGGGFWGDRVDAPIKLLQEEPLDYLMFDYLSELTMSIMAKQRARNPTSGWATDLTDWLSTGGMEALHQRGVKLVTNAGGANPEACAAAVLEIAASIGWTDARLAIITGDDILPRIEDLLGSGQNLAHFETGTLLHDSGRSLLSANAYLGAGPIGAALGAGADIVITGRVADPSLLVGCMLHAAGWVEHANDLNLDRNIPIDEWAPDSVSEPLDVLAQWTIAGHLVECGAQVSGGNSTDWASIPELDNLSLPIAEVGFDGTVVITRAMQGGGRVDRRIVAEQLVYEISDPTAYITPDVVIDLSEVTLTEIRTDSVEVSNATGKPRPPELKVSASLEDGWFASASLLIPGPDAIQRARACDATLRGRLDTTDLSICSELIGAGITLPPGIDSSEHLVEPTELLLRWAVVGENRDEVIQFTREVAPLVLTGPGGVSGYGARGRPRRQLRHWPTLLDRTLVESTVRCDIIGTMDVSQVREIANQTAAARQAQHGRGIRLLGRLHEGLEYSQWTRPFARRIATRVPEVLELREGSR